MKLKSLYGNIVKVTNDPVKQARLKEQGYTEVLEKSKAEKKDTKEKSKAE